MNFMMVRQILRRYQNPISKWDNSLLS